MAHAAGEGPPTCRRAARRSGTPRAAPPRLWRARDRSRRHDVSRSLRHRGRALAERGPRLGDPLAGRQHAQELPHLGDRGAACGHLSGRYWTSWSSLNIGRYIEMMITPTIAPTPSIIRGSTIDVSAWIDVS